MILAASLCFAAASPAWATPVGFEYDWVQTSGSPAFSGYLILDAASGNNVAASTAIVSWVINSGTRTYDTTDSFMPDGLTQFLTWGSIGGGASQITSISPQLDIVEHIGGGDLDIHAGSIIETTDPSGGFYLNGITPSTSSSGSSVPDISNTAVLLWFGLAGLAGFNLSFRARRFAPRGKAMWSPLNG